MEQNNKKKKKGQYSKVLVSLIILLNVIFTIAILFVFLKTGSEPSTLVGAFFGFTTVELWSLAKIKKTKINKNSEGEQNDETRIF